MNFKSLSLSFILLLSVLVQSCAQKSIPTDKPMCSNPEFDQTITKMLSFSTPLISVEELKNIQNDVFIFDARKREEYEVSHIKGARYVGYDDFDEARLEGIPKDAKIVVYCSIGYRSEKIGDKLQKLGYSRVSNLYGSIFEWVNQGFEVVNLAEEPIKKVHTYNSKWSQWLNNDAVEKVW